MILAMPVWNSRLSPVLDTALTLRIVALENGAVVSFKDVPLTGDTEARASTIASEAGVIVCGALSCRMDRELQRLGVTVHPWIMGDIDTISRAYGEGRIHEFEFTMPGCGRMRRHGPHCRKPDGGNRRRYAGNMEDLK